MDAFDVIILGAGVSGLMCAATAAGRGKRVLVIDHAAQPGRKLLVSGGGKCNFTNRHISFEHYRGANPQFTRSALAAFPPDMLISLVEQHNIAIEEREEGQLFCLRSSRKFLDMLLHMCDTPLVAFALGKHQIHVGKNETAGKKQQYRVDAADMEYVAATLVVATGSVAWPQIGSTGIGYKIAKQFGHAVVPPHPALVGLVMPQNWLFPGLEGITQRVTLRHLPQKQTQSHSPASSRRNLPQTDIVADNLSLLFTHSGISGPAALQASLYWSPGDTFSCNFLPRQDLSSLLEAVTGNKQLAKNWLRRYFPSRLADALLPSSLADKQVASLSRQEKQLLIQAVTQTILQPVGTEGFKKAEAAAGGVCTDQIASQNMESKLSPGLFFCGEVLDITGRLGGYNIHWALASGYLAGLSA